MTVMKSFYVYFQREQQDGCLGTKVVFEIVTNTVHASVDEERSQIRALLLGEMEIIVGRNLVRLESWFSRDWDGTKPN